MAQSAPSRDHALTKLGNREATFAAADLIPLIAADPSLLPSAAAWASQFKLRCPLARAA